VTLEDTLQSTGSQSTGSQSTGLQSTGCSTGEQCVEELRIRQPDAAALAAHGDMALGLEGSKVLEDRGGGAQARELAHFAHGGKLTFA
jgi:ATP phosphoribosyltransferase